MWIRSRTPAPVAMPVPLPTPGLIEAQRAHADARARLEETIHRGPEVRAVVDRVTGHGQQNHFYELLADHFYGNKEGNAAP